MNDEYVKNQSERIEWVQIGGQGFAVRVGSLAVTDNGWAEWEGDNGYNYAAPVANIEAVSLTL